MPEFSTSTTPSTAQKLTVWLRLAALAMLFTLTLITANTLRVQPGNLLLIWLPQGVMIAGLLLFDRNEWSRLIVLFASGLFIERLIGGTGIPLGIGLALIRVAGAVVPAWLYRTLERGNSPTENTRSLAVFAGVSVFGCSVSGILGALLESAETGQSFEQAALQWSLAPLLAALTVTPAMLVWVDASVRKLTIRLNLELALILAGVALSASFAFFAARQVPVLPLSTIFILMPWLIWAALRRPEYESATLVLAAMLIAPFEITRNRASLHPGEPEAAMHVGWLTFILLMLTGLTYFLIVKTRERNLAEHMLHERNVRFDTIFNTSPDAVIVIDQKGIVEAFSHTAEKLFGFVASEIAGKNIKILMPPYLAERHDGYLQRYLETGEKKVIGIGRVVTGQRKDGSTFPIELSVGEAFINGKRFFTGFVRDLTEKQGTEQRIHELQDELMHSARLASLGEISSTIAHEVNQPLSAAGTYMQVAEELARSGESDAMSRAAESIGKAAIQVRRAGDIIRRVREFAKKKTPELAQEDINRVIEEACALAFIGTKNTGIRASLDLASNLPLALVDRLQLQQVIVNLVRNSVDAIAGGGAGQIVVRSRQSGDDQVHISVIDNGSGVPEELLSSLFTPFTTTKISGTGLGLAVCKSIVEAHGGRLWYETNPSGGASFNFTIPVVTNVKEKA